MVTSGSEKVKKIKIRQSEATNMFCDFHYVADL